MEFARATAEHHDRLYRLLNSCAEWLNKQGKTHWTGHYTHDRVKAMISDCEVILALSNDEVIGAVSISTEDEAWTDQTPALYVSSLAVTPERQGSGLGSRLLSMVEEQARKQGIRKVRLDAVKDFEILNEFYLTRGYNVVGDVQRNHDYWLYEKTLTGVA